MRNKKSVIVTARMTPEVKQRLQERAQDANMTLSVSSRTLRWWWQHTWTPTTSTTTW